MARRVSGASKIGQRLLAKASRYEGTNLSDVYGRYSSAKAGAYNDCRRWFEADGGYNFRIISHNTSVFSVAWNYIDKETGEVMTRIETSRRTYIIDGSRLSTE